VRPKESWADIICSNHQYYHHLLLNPFKPSGMR